MNTLRPLRLLSSDLDGTLLGNPEATQRFKSVWQALPAKTRPVLVYNSGRLVDDMRKLVASGQLPAPDFYIGGLGTQVFDEKAGRALDDYNPLLDAGWDRSRVEAVAVAFPGIRRQPEEFQAQYK